MPTNELLEWGAATMALPGEAECGDLHVVQPFDGGVLVGVLDGLGHGSEAASAARLAVATLAARAHEPLIHLVRHCHEALRATRGVVMSLASFDARERTMTWLSVGNVDGLLLRADPATQPAYETVLTRGGVVGYRLPQLRAELVPIMSDDLLLLATDGIRQDFATGLNRGRTPQQIADGILARCRKGTDDALVLVARYRGGAT